MVLWKEKQGRGQGQVGEQRHSRWGELDRKGLPKPASSAMAAPSAIVRVFKSLA